MTTIKQFFSAMRALFTSPKALGILAALYALLLATLYGFISTREATVWQVTITFVFLALIPVEFFVLQAATLQYARTKTFSWKQALRDAVKLAVVTIPIVLLGFLIAYLLNKWQAHYQVQAPPVVTPLPKGAQASQPIHWPTVLFATVRLLVLAVILPLATLYLWIEVTARDVRSAFSGGLKPILQRVGSALARAFEFDSVLTYALGLIIFVLVPYAILFVRIPVKGNKTDFTVFVLRLLLVYLFTLIGWIVTLTALARIEPPPAEPASTILESPVEAPA
jgi:hypothetical protein